MAESQPDPSTKKHSDRTSQNGGNTSPASDGPIEVAIVSQVAPTLLAKEIAIQRDREKREVFKHKVELALGAVAVIVAIVAIFQLWVMKGQLDEMAGSSGQTDRLISLYRMQHAQMVKLTSETKTIAEEAKKQAEASRRIATNAVIQSQATKSLADNSAGQLKTMRKQFEVSQRAWIEIVESSVALVKYTENGGFSVSPKLVFQNRGSIPANAVKVVAWVILPDQTKDVEAQAVAAQKLWCDRGLHDPDVTKYAISQRIYPDRKKEYTFGFGGGDARIGGKIGSQGIIQPIMVGCILYQFSSSAETHYTGFILTMHRKDPDGKIGSLIYGREIAPENVIISDFWDGLAESN